MMVLRVSGLKISLFHALHARQFKSCTGTHVATFQPPSSPLDTHTTQEASPQVPKKRQETLCKTYILLPMKKSGRERRAMHQGPRMHAVQLPQNRRLHENQTPATSGRGSSAQKAHSRDTLCLNSDHAKLVAQCFRIWGKSLGECARASVFEGCVRSE
jgi:hypothetical protein